MPERYEVLIVGGGPGGAAAALACAQQGLRVALVERRAFPRSRPGETLHPGIEPLLRKLGVWQDFLALGFLQIPGIWVGWNAPARLRQYGHDALGGWQGYQAWRAEFDCLLLRHAAAQGVEVLQPCSALQPLVCRGRVTGVLTSKGPLLADYVVDASGAGHWLARRLNIALRSSSPTLIAWYGYAPGCSLPDSHLPLLRSTDRGWTWLAQVRADLYHWVCLDLAGGSPRRPTPPQELCASGLAAPYKAANVTWRRVKHLAGAGYMICGDAAWVLDPASSHGVLKAVMSGMMVAHVLGTIFRAPATETQQLRQYERWLGKWYTGDLQTLRDLYADLQAPPEWMTVGDASDAVLYQAGSTPLGV
jgi:flavin-dependent dehydrogenase